MGWMTEVPVLESQWGQEFSCHHVVQTGSGVHPTSYLMVTGGSFPGMQWPGHEADHSPPVSEEVKKCRPTLPLPHISSWLIA
jgi:hypothetical protein